MNPESSEQRPPQVEYWRGHIDVERPHQRVKLPRRFLFALAVALLAGLVTLSAIWLAATHWHHPGLLTAGITLTIVACLGFAALLASPFPIDIVTLGAWHWDGSPPPLYAPALLLFAFALPCLVVALVSITQALASSP